MVPPVFRLLYWFTRQKFYGLGLILVGVFFVGLGSKKSMTAGPRHALPWDETHRAIY